MLKRRKQLIDKLVKEGFRHETLSKFNDPQLEMLFEKMVYPDTPEGIEQAKVAAEKSGEAQVVSDEDESTEEIDIETDNTGNPDVEIDGTPLLQEKGLQEMDLDDRYPNRRGKGNGKSNTDGSTFESPNKDFTKPTKRGKLSRRKEFIPEEFKSKKQQRYFFSQCNDEDLSKKERNKWCKMAKEFSDDTDFETLPEVTMVENWLMGLVEKSIKPEISKKELLRTISEQDSVDEGFADDYHKEYQVNKWMDTTDKIMSKSTNNPNFTSIEQENAFNKVMSIANSARLTVELEEIEETEDSEENILTGYIKSPNSGVVIDLRINSAGDIELDGAPIEDSQDFDEEVKEKEMEMSEQAPITTPTKPKTRPGEKERKGPFKRPKTKPNPKAEDKETPTWFKFNNIKKTVQTED